MKRVNKQRKREISKKKFCEVYIGSNSSISTTHQTTRKNIRRVYASKNQRNKSRIIIQEATQKSLAANEVKTGKQIRRSSQNRVANLPQVGILHSIKNLNIFAGKMNGRLGLRPIVVERAKPEYLPTIDNATIFTSKNNKSFDDLKATIKKRRRIKKIINAARTTIPYLKTESNPMVSKLSMKLFNSSGMRILKTLIDKEESYSTPLSDHDVTPKMRARMVDWMLEVFSVYKKPEDTYFQSVYLLDKYLSLTDNILDDSHIHLLGVTCMFSASKYLDYECISLKDICKNISHEVFDENSILKCENKILETLDFQYDITTPFHFISTILLIVKTLVDDEKNHQLLSCLELTSFQYAKMSLINKDFCQLKPSEIAFGAISNACNFLIKPQSHHTLREISSFTKDQEVINNIVRLFQIMLQKSVFKDIDIDTIEDAMGSHLAHFDEEFSYCTNAHKFSLMTK
ncbi:unnamed protein product [Moneuplotes crassus]|uniref:Cyclin-like domain-containing protein n=1 Tax=Euplotes crassus TaxID=5936 RepID=A0AAD1UL01_EUPCR|nr:unnamed protein product [Moneuplotes crassus]